MLSIMSLTDLLWRLNVSWWRGPSLKVRSYHVMHNSSACIIPEGCTEYITAFMNGRAPLPKRGRNQFPKLVRQGRLKGKAQISIRNQYRPLTSCTLFVSYRPLNHWQRFIYFSLLSNEQSWRATQLLYSFCKLSSRKSLTIAPMLLLHQGSGNWCSLPDICFTFLPNQKTKPPNKLSKLLFTKISR